MGARGRGSARARPGEPNWEPRGDCHVPAFRSRGKGRGAPLDIATDHIAVRTYDVTN